MRLRIAPVRDIVGSITSRPPPPYHHHHQNTDINDNNIKSRRLYYLNRFVYCLSGVGRNKSNIVTFFADNYAGGAGGDYHTTYFPQTTFLSSRNFYCHYSGYNYAEVNLQPPTFHEIFLYGRPDVFQFDVKSSTKELVKSLATSLGLQPELPDWVYTGAALGVQGGTEVVRQSLVCNNSSDWCTRPTTA